MKHPSTFSLLSAPGRKGSLLLVLVLSTLTFVRAQNTWTGSTTDWNTPTNWSLGQVPTATDDVVIPSAPANQPIISAAGMVARTVEVRSGATLTIQSTGTLAVNGSRNMGGNPTAFTNYGTVGNSGELLIGNVSSVGSVGLANQGTFTNNAGAKINIDNSSSSGLINFGGSFTNAAAITIGENTNVGTSGIDNRAIFTNNPGGQIKIDNAINAGLFNINGTFTNAAVITFGATARVGEAGLRNLATFNNNAGGQIYIDNSSIAGLLNQASFTNAASITIGANAGVGRFGIYNLSNFQNIIGGVIEVDNSTEEGLYNASGIFTNAAIITIGSKASVGAYGLSNLATFINNTCADLTLFAAFFNSNSFTNAGLMTVATDAAHSNTALTNEGAIGYPQGNPIPNVTNTALVALPIAGCNAIAPALSLGGGSFFTVGTTWYSDAIKTQPAGTYNAASNTFTPEGLAGGQAHTLYFTVTTSACTQTVPITVTITEGPGAPSLSGASLTVTASPTPISLTQFVTADEGNSLSFYNSASVLLDPPTVDISSAGVQSFSTVQTSAAGCSGPALFFDLTVEGGGTTEPPLSQTVCRGSQVTLTVAVEGDARYQWYETGKSANSRMRDRVGVYAGTSSASLTLLSAQGTSNYYCQVTMGDGSVRWLGQYNVTVNKKCSNARLGEEEPSPFSLTVLSNPIEAGQVRAVVRGASGQPLHIQVYTLQGRLLGQQQHEQADEEQAVAWDLRSQPVGVYVLRAVSNGQVRQVKVLQQAD